MIRNNIQILCSLMVLFFVVQNAHAQSTDKVSETTLERLVSTKISMDKDGAFNDRFTIHIFQGENQAALSTKSRYDALGLQWKSELRYDAPDFKVWIGKYRSRLEADRALMKIQQSFPNAKVLKP